MSEQPRTVQTEIIKSSVPLLNVKVTREAWGLAIYLKSQIFEEHFKALTQNNSNRIGTVASGKFYVPVNYPATRIAGCSIASEPDHGLFHGENVNLGFIRAVGIKDGVTIKITNQVYSVEKIKQWLEAFTKGVKLYWSSTIKPFSMEVEITTREI